MQQRLLNQCNMIMHVVPTEHQVPFAKVIIRLVRLQPPSLKSYSTCQATTPSAKVIFDLSGYNPLRLTMLMQRHNLNAMTQLKCNDINILNSYRINHKRSAHQFKTTEKINQLSTTFIFITKSKSKQKWVKKTQERKTGNLPINNSLGEHNYSLWRETVSTR